MKFDTMVMVTKTGTNQESGGIAVNFKQAFFDSLSANASLAEEIATTTYPLKSLSVPFELARKFPYIQAYGVIHASYPYHYEMVNLDSYCLICTDDGYGLLTLNNHRYALRQGTIAFIDCTRWHKIEIKEAPWNYHILFVLGPTVGFFYSSFTKRDGNLHTFMPDSTVSGKITSLFDFLSKFPNLQLIHIRYISDILFELLMEKNRLHEGTLAKSNYVYQIKHDLDYHYMRNISLEVLEHKYHVSRYQICRDFTAHFHVSPIQYLSRRKVEAAKEMLLRTDERINRIGSMIGFENPNRFIRQFKKQTGVTPMEYRRQSQSG